MATPLAVSVEMHAKRALVVAFVVCAAVAMAYVLYRFGPHNRWFPVCLFRRWTGFLCPGCGMTRATFAALHGRLADAFRFNPVGMVLLPAAMLGLGLELVGWVRGRPLPWRFRAGGRWGWVLVGVLLVFWILRNIPSWPFTLLAPP